MIYLEEWPAPDSSPALVHAIETSRQEHDKACRQVDLPALTISQVFRHSHWHGQRHRIFDALQDLEKPRERLQRYARCGTHCRVVQSDEDPNRYATQSDTCHDRWCQPCATERARRIATHVRTHIAGKRIRMVTLTLKHSDAPLSLQLDRLRDCLRILRRSSLWRTRVTGGCTMFECKWSHATEAWHPHAHLLIGGRYIPHSNLKKLWYAITGDSFIVHIRPCDSDAKAAAYVAKYVGKPWTGDVERSPHLLAQLIVALDRRRLCHTFGDWKGLRLSEPIDTGTWHYVCDLDDLLARAKSREKEALMILERLDSTNRSESVLHASTMCPVARDPPCEPWLWSENTDCLLGGKTIEWNQQNPLTIS